jgi:hypothetical protein
VTDDPPATKPVRTPDAIEARSHRIANSFADDILNQLDGFAVGREIKGHFDAAHFVRWCDPEVPPWSCAADHMKQSGLLSRALEILQRSTDDNHRRRSLFNLATAIKAWDFFKLTQIAGAIVKDAENRTRRIMPPVPGRVHIPRGFVATRQVTEVSTEYDVIDPAYVAGAISWDDRAESDMAYLD